MPFPSTRVVHPAWSQHHRPTAEGAQTATCTIIGPGTGGGWDPVTGPTAGAAGQLLYDDTCAIEAQVAAPDRSDAAGQATTEHPYLVSIRHAAPDIPIGARVTVTACPDDAALVGKVLTVADVQYGSLQWDRVLMCDLDLTNQEA